MSGSVLYGLSLRESCAKERLLWYLQRQESQSARKNVMIQIAHGDTVLLVGPATTALLLPLPVSTRLTLLGIPAIAASEVDFRYLSRDIKSCREISQARPGSAPDTIRFLLQSSCPPVLLLHSSRSTHYCFNSSTFVVILLYRSYRCCWLSHSSVQSCPRSCLSFRS